MLNRDSTYNQVNLILLCHNIPCTLLYLILPHITLLYDTSSVSIHITILILYTMSYIKVLDHSHIYVLRDNGMYTYLY